MDGIKIQRRAKVDGEGNLLGFYSDDIHPQRPAGAVDITEEQYRQWGAAEGVGRKLRLIDGVLTEDEPTPVGGDAT